MSEFTPAVHVVQAFLDAYNTRDIEQFVAQLHEHVVFEDDNTPTLIGTPDVRRVYGDLFARDVDQQSTLLGRMVLGRYVIDKEYITGRPNSPFTTIAIYQVDDGKISRVRLLRETGLT